MSTEFEKVWETYSASWKLETSKEKRDVFESCLDSQCVYNDPMTKTKGWDSLIEYMLDFHKRVPGGYFVTKYFLAHNNQSIARWDMKNSDDVILGDGISYGKYNESGKLVSMTGFYETP